MVGCNVGSDVMPAEDVKMCVDDFVRFEMIPNTR